MTLNCILKCTTLTSTNKNAIIHSLITDYHLKQTIQFKVPISMEGGPSCERENECYCPLTMDFISQDSKLLLLQRMNLSPCTYSAALLAAAENTAIQAFPWNQWKDHHPFMSVALSTATTAQCKEWCTWVPSVSFSSSYNFRTTFPCPSSQEVMSSCFHLTQAYLSPQWLSTSVCSTLNPLS